MTSEFETVYEYRFIKFFNNNFDNYYIDFIDIDNGIVCKDYEGIVVYNKSNNFVDVNIDDFYYDYNQNDVEKVYDIVDDTSASQYDYNYAISDSADNDLKIMIQLIIFINMMILIIMIILSKEL